MVTLKRFNWFLVRIKIGNLKVTVNSFLIENHHNKKLLFGKEEAVEGYDEKIIFELNDDLLGLKENGNIKGKTEDLVKLFKSVYTPKSN